ncbi:terminase ATPase subunit family protein [Undibacterium sp. CCC2.1]|uniref:terminase ATPase subunit family protein n=3 Tax=Pseudomonadota TaxID=1224 RepID=UPI002AC9B179|nr:MULTISPECIES: terminase ATPase subunit family protein [unclassified Undibacterium]MEB0138010.1 terminase ATPase subunit family protein [Undibacterium sp. CCC2.1]MEB0170657.1 terminase ATPase subunit family protein [Undibacterium sp. CCC1.1]MEB0176998.1 terminase ATPase subunit family protein [Undibacterium sp. CCC3.4]MEB0216286.1 terminase ATPase subunit family protein [Undibacterium sp. 5I2]WPX42472.1 terminase ATPase subunit family protein [Undibacterium sp. CCC3.4]
MMENDATLLANKTDMRRLARALYWQGWRISSIAQHLDIKRSTVQSWCDRDHWDKASVIEKIETALDARLVQLIAKDLKTGGDFKEIDLLTRQVVQMARVRRYEEPGGNEVDLNPNLAKRHAGPKKKAARNDYSDEQREQLLEAFRDSLFDYQKSWLRNGHQRTRVILKSRQIGATWYFAREALADAFETGRNQIFLSASKAQAHVFKQYIVQFAKEAAGIELSGDPIVLPNGAHLYFLGTNARTAQGYHGNFYFDEFFWTHQFQELNKVASGMALHKQWRKTYFSTPSSITHEAYPFWTGDLFNKRRPKKDQVHIDISHARLQSGYTGEDKIWRQIVTIMDAERGGCNLFDIDELRSYEYSPDQFDNLLMCHFIDDTKSIFPLTELQKCMVDAWLEWTDFKPFTTRPYGDNPVWIGYDPAHTGDSAGIVILAPPRTPGGKFRVLEKTQFRGMDFAAQAELIRQSTIRYHVGFIGIDATGMGEGVYQLVKNFYPSVTKINYDPAIKSRMVLKAQDVISKGRLEFDAGATELAQSFMAIKKTLTASGQQVTYKADRNEETGHADLAWACMHALDHEPLDGGHHNSQSFMEIYA